jgi:hypothetical protein
MEVACEMFIAILLKTLQTHRSITQISIRTKFSDPSKSALPHWAHETGHPLGLSQVQEVSRDTMQTSAIFWGTSHRAQIWLISRTTVRVSQFARILRLKEPKIFSSWARSNSLTWLRWMVPTPESTHCSTSTSEILWRTWRIEMSRSSS